MTWLTDHWIDVLGWGGSALLVFSLLQARVLRFRTLNLVACVVLVAFNAIVGVWPMAAMNAVLCVINVCFIVKLVRERHDDAAFEVIAVGTGDQYLRHVLATHAADIRRFQPDFTWEPGDEGHAFVVAKGDETVGVVVIHGEGEVARVLLDYVTPRYRDFSPGEFVWRRSGILTNLGYRVVRTSARMVGPYYEKVGFVRAGPQFELTLD